MKIILPIVFAVLTVALIAAGSVHQSSNAAASTPEGTVHSMLANVKTHNWQRAYSYVNPASNTDFQSFQHDLEGQDGSLRSYSQLEGVDTRVLHESDTDATIRTELKYSTAVGAFYDTRDLKLVKSDGGWKVNWLAAKRPSVPPQVIPVNYLRWDIVWRGTGDDWGAQNVQDPNVRIISMNPVERDGSIIIMGEVQNEDTVPAFVSVGATLVGKNDQDLAEESSFDRVSHVLLPKEVSPYRIDFPGMKLAQVKSVRMKPDHMLVPASADPVIGVLHQRVEKDAKGRTVLKGELLNESGQTVNIPHVLATFYDASGRVIWVADGYVDRALLPQTPEPFAVEVRDDLASTVQNYRVTVNEYSRNRQE
ncbi:MAG TPA: hypothetical protein VG649_12025 [Candidatus Angelobacter sp.]|jgi:hypothetical protein|nr:hypothetical protein [Candidatus Angelobacter sp.]